MFLYLKNILSLIKVNYQEKYADFKNKKKIQKNPQIRKQLDALKKNGFIVIENFYTTEICEEIKKEIDQIILKYGDKLEIDNEGADHRVWGAERVSAIIKKFHDDKLLQEIAEAYTKTPIVNHMTLAAKLIYKSSNKGSGGGWHRDSAHEQQFKSILYLSDVTIDNGPYQYLSRSHKLRNVLRSFKYEKEKRFRSGDLDKFVNEYRIPIETITAKAGTLILTDTRGIHRGMPIEKGERYALTNYYVGVHRHNRFKEYFDSLIKFPPSVSL
jgi:ectoine hydroxylase-related dioxygenase (phytanoyl-CoA dioxygenase family)